MALPGVKVIRASRSIVQFGSYPNGDGLPIPDQDLTGTGEFEWLLVHEPISIENYIADGRYYQVVTNITKNAGDEHPSYPGVGRYLITYSVQKNSNDVILEHLENAENDANSLVWPLQKQFKVLAIASRAAYKKNAGLNLLAIEQACFDLMLNYTNKLIDNYSNAAAKKTQILANNEPDLDSGWITE